MRTTREQYRTADFVLAVGAELAGGQWKLAFDDGRRRTPRIVVCSADTARARVLELVEALESVKRRWQLPTDVRVVVGYEAGQDGFWLARALAESGLEAVVIDPASVPVERHRRRRKTDRLDAIRLVLALRRWLRGEYEAMRVVRMPSAEVEDQRWRVRDRKQLQKEANQHRDRMRKLLRTQGCWAAVDDRFGARLAAGELRDWQGRPLGAGLCSRLKLEWARLELVRDQLKQREAELRRGEGFTLDERARMERLIRLRALGAHTAIPLVLELYWRDFHNRREVGGCTGLAGQPYDSGLSRIDQGISKQGRRQVRALLIELAWLWLRYQPDSELSRWYHERTEGQGKRVRRIMIVAVARKLAIALWRYLENGEIPAGARLKAA